MTSIKNYLQDGANHQSRAVLMLLQPFCDIEDSWSKNLQRYASDVVVSRWENCREQGYVVSMRAKNLKQINIAFFQHRNSDSIHAVEWVQTTLNCPNINTAVFNGVYRDKFDTSYRVEPYQVWEMAQWISTRLETFWRKNKNK